MLPEKTSERLKHTVIRCLDRESGKSQKNGQEDQGTLKQLGGPGYLFYLSLVLLAFLLAVPTAGGTGNMKTAREHPLTLLSYFESLIRPVRPSRAF